MVFDLLGKTIAETTADNNLVEFTKSGLTTGVYMVRIEKENQFVVKKLIVN